MNKKVITLSMSKGFAHILILVIIAVLVIGYIILDPRDGFCAIDIPGVCHVGFNITTRFTRQTTPSPSPTPISTTPKETSEVSDVYKYWDIYYENKIMFKHPKSWKVNTDFSSNFRIEVKGPSKEINKDNTLKPPDYDPGYETYEKYSPIENVKVRDYNAYYQSTFRDDFMNIKTYVVSTSDGNVVLTFYSEPTPEKEIIDEYEQTVSLILQTFNFTNETLTVQIQNPSDSEVDGLVRGRISNIVADIELFKDTYNRLPNNLQKLNQDHPEYQLSLINPITGMEFHYKIIDEKMLTYTVSGDLSTGETFSYPNR